jgi:hypothetical protein
METLRTPKLGAGHPMLQTKQTSDLLVILSHLTTSSPSCQFLPKANSLFVEPKLNSMDQAQDVHLEEVFWRSPQHVQMMGGFLHSNNSKLKQTRYWRISNN